MCRWSKGHSTYTHAIISFPPSFLAVNHHTAQTAKTLAKWKQKSKNQYNERYPIEKSSDANWPYIDARLRYHNSNIFGLIINTYRIQNIKKTKILAQAVVSVWYGQVIKG